MRIMFITPHLSTGGAPQYLLKKIQELKDVCDVYCVEYSNVTGGVLVVQRNQIESILGDKLISLGDDKHELMKHIFRISPDVIHFEELPEYFFDSNVANKIYVSDRKYKIIETSHDSSFDINNKLFFPDKFVFVSEYQKQLFSSLNIPSTVVEYPITYKVKSCREKSLEELGLDPKKTHFLNVGLFTSRKNQSEIVDYARKLVGENIQFHFVGNQADNFKSYWEPIMKNFPPNCKWWGERKDVDAFYNAMDVFLFTSKGTSTDKETNPLVVREAIGWNIPTLMYNLPVYCGMYDKYKNITWLKNNLNENLNTIKSFVTNTKKELFDITFDDKDNKFNITYNGTKSLNNVIFSIKDKDSKACIYSCKWDTLQQNASLWIIPVPKNHYDFINNTNFGGFLIKVLDDSGPIYIKEIKFKELKISKPIIEFSDIDPIFMNYNEFFVDKIYNECALDNLNTCIDIGANVGLFSKYLKSINVKNIICYEPNRLAFNQLEKNLKVESGIVVYNKAVSCNNDKLKLYIDDNNTLISSGCNKTNNYYEVECITLSQVIKQNNLNVIDLVKIDIEGMEFDLINNCDSGIFDKVQKFLIEYHDFYFENGMDKVKILCDVLKNNGYKITMPEKYKFIYGYK